MGIYIQVRLFLMLMRLSSPEQHWTLMPTHAVLSTVRPSSFLYGPGSGYGGPNAMTFPQYVPATVIVNDVLTKSCDRWLGQNSKQNKLGRALGDVQIRMRLKVSGDKSEIRTSYLPAMFPLIVKPLMEEGSVRSSPLFVHNQLMGERRAQSAVDDVIKNMDDYYVSREDWDTIIELGIGEQKDDVVLKKIATATKTALTRKYNSRDHPIPFHKAQDLGKVPKKLPGGPAPDLEEAFDVSTCVGPRLTYHQLNVSFARWMTLSMMQMTTRRLSIRTISSSTVLFRRRARRQRRAPQKGRALRKARKNNRDNPYALHVYSIELSRSFIFTRLSCFRLVFINQERHNLGSRVQ